MDLAAALKRIDALGRRSDVVAVEIGRPLFELRKVLDAPQRPLRAEQPLDVYAAEGRRINASAVRLRPDVAHQVRRCRSVAVDVAIKTGHALHPNRLLRLAIRG